MSLFDKLNNVCEKNTELFFFECFNKERPKQHKKPCKKQDNNVPKLAINNVCKIKKCYNCTIDCNSRPFVFTPPIFPSTIPLQVRQAICTLGMKAQDFYNNIYCVLLQAIQTQNFTVLEDLLPPNIKLTLFNPQGNIDFTNAIEPPNILAILLAGMRKYRGTKCLKDTQIPIFCVGYVGDGTVSSNTNVNPNTNLFTPMANQNSGSLFFTSINADTTLLGASNNNVEVASNTVSISIV